MRYLLTLASLLLLEAGCREPSDVLPLNAPVTSLAQLPTTYQPAEGSPVAGRLKRESSGGKTSGEWRYNERGQLLEWRLFRLGAVGSAVQYRYDAAGRLRFVQHFSNNCGFSSLSTCTGPLAWTSYEDLTTDAAGRVTESRSYLSLNGSWDFRSRSVLEYNARGQLVTLRRYDAQGTLTQTQTLTYDARGNVIALREQSSVASPELSDRTFTYTYDNGRNPYVNTVYYTSPLFLSPNNQLMPGFRYEYRADGQPSRMVQNGSVFDLEYY